MNVMLQRHCAKYIYVIPDGLRELMSDISREVLRTQPIHIYTFIADYLDALLITRENARIAAKLVESITEIACTTVDLLERIGMTRSEADRVATTIQNSFHMLMTIKKSKLAEMHKEDEIGTEEERFVKAILEQSNFDLDQLDEAATIIQQAYRAFKERQERQKNFLFGMVDWRIAARSAIHLYRNTGVTPQEANKAATLIKAAYKGYYTRRIMKKLMHDGLNTETVQIIDGSVDREDIEEEEDEVPESYYGIAGDDDEEGDETLNEEEGETNLDDEVNIASYLSTSEYEENPLYETYLVSDLDDNAEALVPVPEVVVVEGDEVVVVEGDEVVVVGDEVVVVEGGEVGVVEGGEVGVVEGGEVVVVEGDEVVPDGVPPLEIPPTDGDNVPEVPPTGEVASEVPPTDNEAVPMAEGDVNPAEEQPQVIDAEDKTASEPVTEIIVPAPSEAQSTVESTTERTDVTETTEVTETDTEQLPTETATDGETTEG